MQLQVHTWKVLFLLLLLFITDSVFKCVCVYMHKFTRTRGCRYSQSQERMSNQQDLEIQWFRAA